MEFRWIEWNLEKIASHGVTRAETEFVIEEAEPPYPQYRQDDRLLVWGATVSGRLLQVVYLLDPDDTVFVIHARPLTEGERHRRRQARLPRGKQ